MLNEAHDAVAERRVELGKATRMPTSAGLFDAVCATDRETGLEHIAMLKGYTTDAYSYLQRADAAMPVDGDSGAAAEAPLVRLHSECATGDILGRSRCDCGEQLKAGLEAIQAAEAGVLIYLRGHEGRGIGLGAKLEAYTLQDEGRDTIEANEDLGHPVDARDYEAGAAILQRFRCLWGAAADEQPGEVRGLGGTGHQGRRAHPGRDGAEREQPSTSSRSRSAWGICLV